MSRYIDADAFDDTVQTLNEQGWNITRIDYKRMDRVLFEMPTADVVEVVRCRDCTWWKSIFSWNGKEHKVCVRESAEPSRESDDYCSYGERRENE